jgi:hypothetical protein
MKRRWTVLVGFPLALAASAHSRTEARFSEADVRELERFGASFPVAH